jgi:hypothetical protein
MIDFKDIQTTARDTIKAFVDTPGGATEAYFANDLVEADTGTSKDTIENALNTRGVAVIVDLPISGGTFHRGVGVAETYVTLPVHVQVNQSQNTSSGGAGMNVLEVVQNVFAALLSYGDGDGESADRFDTEEDALSLMANDAGLTAYVLWFRKLVPFS